jgi:hypothetical protein
LVKYAKEALQGRSNSRDSRSCRNQSPPNNRSGHQTNLSPDRFHSSRNREYLVWTQKGESQDSSSRRTDPSYSTRMHNDEPPVVAKDPGSRGPSYHSHNYQKGSHTRARNPRESDVPSHGVGLTDALPFGRGQSSFQPTSSVVPPRYLQKNDRDHSMRMPEPPLANQARMNSNPKRLRHKAKLIFPPLTNTDTIEIRGTRISQSDSIVKQGVDSGSTPSSTVPSRIESNECSSKHHRNSASYGAERHSVPATTSLSTTMGSLSHDYPAARGPETDAHRGPLEQPRQPAIVTELSASLAGSVDWGFDSGYDETRHPHRIPNVNTASGPPIAFYNARGRRPRSNSRYGREGTKNSRSSSISKDSGISMDEDRIGRRAWREEEQLLRRSLAHV